VYILGQLKALLLLLTTPNIENLTEANAILNKKIGFLIIFI
jgi:hypothetical protein